jgi:hypothetical protein
VRFEVAQGADANGVKANVWFIRAGKVVGRMDGLEAVGNASLNRIAGGLGR